MVELFVRRLPVSKSVVSQVTTVVVFLVKVSAAACVNLHFGMLTVFAEVPKATDLLVRVSVVSLATRVRVPVGKVIVPELDIVEITGEVSVLLVKVSVVSLPTKVVVAVGNVIVPVFEMVEITGAVKVLFVKVWDPSVLTKVCVPEGKVQDNPSPPLIILSVIPGEVIVGVVIEGEVKVLFVNVSVVALPTKVSVEVGRESVPVFTSCSEPGV